MPFLCVLSQLPFTRKASWTCVLRYDLGLTGVCHVGLKPVREACEGGLV